MVNGKREILISLRKDNRGVKRMKTWASVVHICIYGYFGPWCFNTILRSFGNFSEKNNKLKNWKFPTNGKMKTKGR